MYRSTFFMLIFIFNAVGISFVVADTTRQEIIDIMKSYPKIMDLSLNPNSKFYIEGFNTIREAIYPPSNESSTELSSDGSRAPDLKVIDLFIWYFNIGRFNVIKVLLLNAIASVCYTYMYRFCAYAIEMNIRRADLKRSLIQFNKLLMIMQRIFRNCDIPSIFIDHIIGIYDLYNPAYFPMGYTVPDDEYRHYLQNFMESIESSINFVKLECYDQSVIGQLDLKDLNTHQLKDVQNAGKLLKSRNVETVIQTSRPGIQDGRTCMICFENFNVDDEILSLAPCGHTDICINCKDLAACPLCRMECESYVRVNIMKPLSRMRGRDIWERISRKDIDQDEARCVSCNEGVPLEHKLIAFPCGHGLYCQKCSTCQKCPICGLTIERLMKIYF